MIEDASLSSRLLLLRVLRALHKLVDPAAKHLTALLKRSKVSFQSLAPLFAKHLLRVLVQLNMCIKSTAFRKKSHVAYHVCKIDNFHFESQPGQRERFWRATRCLSPFDIW